MRRDLLLGLLLLGPAALLAMFRAPAEVPAPERRAAVSAVARPRLGAWAPTFVPGRDLGCPTSDYTHVANEHR